MWRVRWVAETGSTNADVLAAAAEGEPEGYVLAAGHQTRGRGRLGRSWESPRGTSLSVSFLLRPAGVPPARWPWLPLLVGVAAVDAVADAAGVAAVLKWPNDVLLDGRKLAGILVERTDTPSGAAAVAGVGMNVQAAPPDAASLAHTGVTSERVLDALQDRVAARYTAWLADPASAELADAYRARCDTLGRQVRAELPSGEVVTGQAVDVDTTGRLVIATADGEQAVSAGEIVHLRPSHLP